MRMLFGWLLSFTTTIGGENHMLFNILFMVISLLFGEGSSKAIDAFSSGIMIEVGDGCSTRFWLDHWVSDNILAKKFSNLFTISLNPCAKVKQQTCELDGFILWAPHFKEGHTLPSQYIWSQQSLPHYPATSSLYFAGCEKMEIKTRL